MPVEHPLYDENKHKEFISRLEARALPRQKAARVKALAKELAEGAIEELWLPSFYVTDFEKPECHLRHYFRDRWGGYAQAPSMSLLRAAGYLDYVKGLHRINTRSFDLLDAAPDVNVFISYSRRESSAFALLVLSHLKNEGINAFVDMALEPGEDWSAGLVRRIGESEYVVALLGNHTLESPYVISEILWAHEAGVRIIPVWHNGFIYPAENAFNLPPELHSALQTTQTIRVLEESALGYNMALVELLNWFGITPG